MKFREGRVAVKSGHGGPGLEPSYPLALSLSGGGDRAALFGLGVTMAMHDAKKTPEYIVSVSGGSITNMILADQFFSTGNNDSAAWERATKDAFDRIRAGSLTRPWITAMVLYVLSPIAVGAYLLLTDSRLLLWFPFFLVIWSCVLLLRGHLIEAIMARRYLGPAWRRRTIDGLQVPGNNGRTHTFCCTDLVLGQPVHFSSDGSIFRRIGDPKAGSIPLTLEPQQQRARLDEVGLSMNGAGRVRLSAVLRATAAFPGIPPRLVHWKRLNGAVRPAESYPPSEDVVTPIRRKAIATLSGCLSDGGVWNNLATEPYEDGFILDLYGPWVVIVADASGLPRPASPFVFRIPGLAEIRSLLRETTILSTNTVGPRRRAFDNDIFIELRHPGTFRFSKERFYPVVGIEETPMDLVQRFRQNFFEPEQYKYTREGTGIPERYTTVARRIDELSNGTKRFADYVSWSGIQDGRRDVARYPTTLGRVRDETAMSLVMRGYVNTALTLYLCNLSANLPGPTGWLAERLVASGEPRQLS
jgi:Patatin-like phospholipase